MCTTLSVGRLVGWFVSRITQKTTDQISTKLDGGMGHGPRKILLNFSVDPEFVSSSVSLSLQDTVFVDIFSLVSQGMIHRCR